MKTILLAAVALLAAGGQPSQAAFIANLGLDPSSATGNFSNSLGTSTGAFADDYTFSLDRQFNFTIASATNVFPTPSDFITAFTGGVFAGTPAARGAEVLGPDHAIACPLTPDCQFLSGSAILGSGNYFLEISGVAGGSSGYGGNVATFAVPAPLLGTGLPGLLAGLGGLGWLVRNRQNRKRSLPGPC